MSKVRIEQDARVEALAEVRRSLETGVVDRAADLAQRYGFSDAEINGQGS